jgi:hypothetical protein
MDFLRPWSLTIAGVCLFFVWAWVAMSGMDYDGTSPLTAFTTAGWFVLGIPCIGGLSLAYSAICALLARKLHVVIGWSALLITASCMILFTVQGTLPNRRLARIVGDDTARVATIHRLREMDSFGDGTSTSGVISGPGNLLDLIIAHRGLDMPRMTALHVFDHHGLDTRSLPDYGETYQDDHSIFYRHPDSQRIYFKYRSDPSPYPPHKARPEST